MLRVVVSRVPESISQQGMPSSVVKDTVSPDTTVHSIPLVPLRSGMPTEVVGLMLALSGCPASIKANREGRFSQLPVYPAAHWSQVCLTPALEYLPVGHALQVDAELVLTIWLCSSLISAVVSFWLRTPATEMYPGG